MSADCQRIGFLNNSSITIDDDKMRARSSKWSTIGLPRSKGVKAFGPVYHVACNVITYLFLAGAMSMYNLSTWDILCTVLRLYIV